MKIPLVLKLICKVPLQVILFDSEMDIDAGLRHAHGQKNLKSFVTLLDVTL